MDYYPSAPRIRALGNPGSEAGPQLTVNDISVLSDMLTGWELVPNVARTRWELISGGQRRLLRGGHARSLIVRGLIAMVGGSYRATDAARKTIF